jgi:excisionase family DNA binding protein
MARPSKHAGTLSLSVEAIALSVEEASRISRLGRTHLFEAIRSGALPSLKIGKSRRILRKDLETYLESFRVA